MTDKKEEPPAGKLRGPINTLAQGSNSPVDSQYGETQVANASLEGPGDNQGETLPAHLREILTPEYVEDSLEVARELVKFGIPVIVAERCPDDCQRRGHSNGSVEFHFPEWKGVTANLATLDDYRPGDALLLMGGHGVDGVDTDPRNGGTESRNALIEAGMWPTIYGMASTPSGGTHELIASLGVPKDTPAPGVDVQAGVNGDGHGLLYIAPTVRIAQAGEHQGEYRRYEWSMRPELGMLAEERDTDDSGEALRNLINERKTRVDEAGRVLDRATGHTVAWGKANEEWWPQRALAFIEPALEKLRNEPSGTINFAVNEAALCIGHFVPHLIPLQEARRMITAAAWENGKRAAARGEYGYDGKTWQVETRMLSGLADGMAQPAKMKSSLLEVPEQRSGQEENLSVGPLPTVSLNLPSEFWEARPALRHIQQAAYSRGRSADLVLHTVLARLAAMAHHELRFETVIGDGSLNFFVAAVGPSGTGKSSGVKVASRLLPVPYYLSSEPGAFVDGAPLGSGEGLAEMYMGSVEEKTDEVYKSGPRAGEFKTRTVRKQARHNAFLYLDEGEALTQQSSRKGATIGPAIRQAWGGETLGQQNANIETTRILKEGSYSMGMVIGFQPKTALPVMQEVGPGTPQRFLWVLATDPNVPDQPTQHPGPLTFERFGPLEVGILSDGHVPEPLTALITFPEEVNRELWTRSVARVRGEVEDADLDSHIPLMRCKVASLLALLDGRSSVSLEDWQLSEVVWNTNAAVRNSVVAYGKKEEARVQEERAQRQVETAGRVEVKKIAASAAIERVARNIAKRVHREGELTAAEARRKTPHRDRDSARPAIEFAAARDWIEVDEETQLLRPGGSFPRD